jgi:hypothetical protein
VKGAYQHFGPHGTIALNGLSTEDFISSAKSRAINSPISPELAVSRKGILSCGWVVSASAGILHQV